MTVIGTCGNCGGMVTLPTAWWSIFPPTPQCQSCGSTPRESHGPTIPMNPRPQWDRYGGADIRN